MAENKTKATQASVETYFANIADEGRRRDCEALAALMARVTKQPAVMWGTGIVGLGPSPSCAGRRALRWWARARPTVAVAP